jgi:hypothetical protein
MSDPAVPGRSILVPVLAVAAMLVLGAVLVWRQIARPVAPPEDAGRFPAAPVPAELLHHRCTGRLIYHDTARAWGLATAADGRLVVAGEAGLAIFAADGAFIRRIDHPGVIRAVAWPAADTFLCCIGGTLSTIDGTGTERGRIDFGPGARIDAVTVGGGWIFLADGGVGVIRRLPADGHGPTLTWGGEDADDRFRLKVPGPWFDLVWDGTGLLVANPGRHRVQRYDPDGNLIGQLGGVSATDLSKFVGCCNPVAVAALPGGRMLVTEKGISRAKILDQDGAMVSVVAQEADFRRLAGGRHAFAIDAAIDARGRILLLESHGNTVEIWEELPPVP